MNKQIIKGIRCRVFHMLQGTDHLTVTWKVEENILHHIDIREQGKPNQFSLGKSLWIGSDVRPVLSTFVDVQYASKKLFIPLEINAV